MVKTGGKVLVEVLSKRTLTARLAHRRVYALFFASCAKRGCYEKCCKQSSVLLRSHGVRNDMGVRCLRGKNNRGKAARVDRGIRRDRLHPIFGDLYPATQAKRQIEIVVGRDAISFSLYEIGKILGIPNR